MIDTARADHFSYQGWPRKTTPNIDALAAESVDYRDAHSVSPWTLPSHMSMFTGLLPGDHGATWEAFSKPANTPLHVLLQRPFTLERPERLLANRLRRSGYATLAVSSNPWVTTSKGFAGGFDHFVDAWQVQFAKADATRRPLLAEADRALLELGDAEITLQLLRRAFDEHDVREPFFVFVNFMDPHYPYRPPSEFLERLGLGAPRDESPHLEMELMAGGRDFDFDSLVPFYDAELAYTDHVVGRLLRWLKDRGSYDRSMIVLTSDHGEHLGEGGRFSHQLSVEEELLHVPLLIRYPGGEGAGTVVKNPLASTLDIYATVLAAARADPIGAPPAEELSRDLSRWDALDRDQLMAENYFSDAYLMQIQRISSAFDVAAQRTVRRAVYTGRHRYLFHDGELRNVDPIPSPANGPHREPSREEVARLVSERIDRVSAGERRGPFPQAD